MLELSYYMAAHVIAHTHIHMHKHINYPDSKPHQFNLDLFKVHTLTLSFFSLRLVLSSSMQRSKPTPTLWSQAVRL